MRYNLKSMRQNLIARLVYLGHNESICNIIIFIMDVDVVSTPNGEEVTEKAVE